MQKGAQVDSKDNVSILFILRYLKRKVYFYIIITIVATHSLKYRATNS